MELTLFLTAKNIVSHMTRNVLKCLDKNIHFSTKQFCIVKSFLRTVPFEAIKSYISVQATVTSVPDIVFSLNEGQKGKLLVPTA
jgi:hypothetical protein